MIESHLHEGRQNIESGKPLQYGQSITDACLSFDNTIPLLEDLAAAVQKRRRTWAAKQTGTFLVRFLKSKLTLHWLAFDNNLS